MAKEIIINTTKKQTQIAIVEDGTLAEFHVESSTNARTMGDIYLGRVRSVVPTVKAAFVDIGFKHDAFLSFAQLDENLEAQLDYVKSGPPHLEKNPPQLVVSPRGERKRRRYGSPDLLKKGQRIMVQVVKEPYSTKGAAVTSRLAISGRFLVLIPMASFAAVSRKISSRKERLRLRSIARGLAHPAFGVIVRTVAEGRSKQTIKRDMELLLRRWRKVEERIAESSGKPHKVHSDQGMTVSIVRDLFSSDYDRILVDSPRMYHRLRRYVKAVAPHLKQSVRLYKGRRPIFHEAGIQSSIDEAQSKNIDLPSGGNIVIEQTEAMHVVDVNTGARRKKAKNAENNYLTTNLEAAEMIARQIRLRDLGGTIVVDFVNMREAKHRTRLFNILRAKLASDRASTEVFPMTDLGLIQIARERTRLGIRPADERDPQQLSPRDLLRSIEARLGAWCHNGNNRKLMLRVHPFTAAYLDKGLYSHRRQWRLRHKVKVVLKEEPGMPVMSFSLGALPENGVHGNGIDSKRPKKRTELVTES